MHRTCDDTAPGLHPAYLRLLLLQLKRAGLSADPLLERAGIRANEVESEGAHLDVERVQRLINAAVEATGRPWLGLEFGAGVPVLGHGPLGLAAAASASLREALDLIARFLQLRAPLIQLHLSTAAGGVWAEFRAHPRLQSARLFVTEAALVMLERLLQGLSAGDFAQARIELPWPRPDWARHYPRFFVSPLRFNARAARLWLPAVLVDAPCLSADPAALAFARAECERRLADTGAGLDAVAALRRRLSACDGHYPDAATVAAELGLSLRSFFRLLAQEGVRWRALLDEARRQRALQLLRETELSVERIAERLGYVDASNFSRCLRRWYGRSARELRG
jgi:AraC-like DNA-binding protein